MDQQEETQQVVHGYVSVLMWPVIAAGIVQIAGTHQDNTEQIVLCTNAVLVLSVLWKARHNLTNWQTASVVGALCGGIAALFPAINLLITDFHIVRIFTLMTQPAITGVLMAIATGFLYSMLQLISPVAKNRITKNNETL